MRRTQLKLTETKIDDSPYWCVTWPKPGRGRNRQHFKDEAAAAKCLKEKERELENYGRNGMLSAKELSAVHEAREALGPFGKTLLDALDFFVKHLKAAQRCDLTVSQFKDQYLGAKQLLRDKGELSAVHIRDLETRLNKFCETFGKEKLTEVEFTRIEKWLLNYTNGNRRNFYTVVGGMFNEALRLQYLTENPLTRIKKPKKSEKSPNIFTVNELAALLETAAEIEPDILPMLAICAFAGVRSDIVGGEISKLDWSMVKLQAGHIDLSSEITKKSRRRLVPILPNLAQWLAPYAGLTGKVVPVNAPKKIKRICEAAGVAWKKNGLRHGYASYRMAAISDGPRVAAELGHTNPTLLYSTYREVVQPEEAARYWQIAPKEPVNVAAAA